MFDHITLKDENYRVLLKKVTDWLEENDSFALRELNMHRVDAKSFIEKDFWVASVWLE